MKIEEEIKQNKFHSPFQKAVINIIYTANWIQHHQQQFFKPHGLTGQQFNILRILKGQYPGSISVSEIKSRMLDKNSDVSRLLHRLENKHLIVKETCPSDKRAANVFITEKGLMLLEQLNEEQKSLDEVLSLSEEEALQLSSLLDKARADY